MVSHSPTLILGLLSVLLMGCSTITHVQTQEVLIDSKPSQAMVYRDNELVGATPLVLSLHKKEMHRLRLTRKHFEPAILEIAPSRNDRGQGKLRIGPLEDIGAYHELSPNPALVLMKPELEPLSYGADRFQTLADAVTEADLLLKEGEISKEEHGYIMERLIALFEDQ